jgi:hypothetical protein
MLHSTVKLEPSTRHWPFTISVFTWSQYDAVQLNGLKPLPMSVASEASLHQSRNSLPELITRSSCCPAMTVDAKIERIMTANRFIRIFPVLILLLGAKQFEARSMDPVTILVVIFLYED